MLACVGANESGLRWPPAKSKTGMFLSLSIIHWLLTGLIPVILNYCERLQNIDSELLERISEHHRIIGFRNILIHGYDIVDEAIVWQAVTKHLPILIAEVKEMLSA